MDIQTIQAWSYLPMQGLLIVAVVVLWHEQMRLRLKMEAMLETLFETALDDTAPIESPSKTTS